jgi:hypothetical protein
MGFANVRDLVDATLAGQGTFYSWRKSPSQASTANVWFDMSMSPGNPVPQYYAAAPLVGVPLSQSVDGGIPHGGNVAGVKHLKSFTALATAVTALPMPMILCDYLLFYPFIDEGSTDPQPLVNNIALPRYPDGEGVQIMAVSVAGRTGGRTFQVTYTNSDGVSDRLSQVVIQNTAPANGTIVSSGAAGTRSMGPFIGLQGNDTGVRSIESVQMISGTDVGLFSLVLVQPIAQSHILGIDAVVECNYFTDYNLFPVIKNDAYLSLICNPRGTLAATAIHGTIETVWSN